MKKIYKKIICCALAAIIALSLVSCSAENSKDKETTELSSSAENLTSSAADVSVSENSTTEKANDEQPQTSEENETTVETSNANSAQVQEQNEKMPISVNQALDVLTDFYGSTYNVNATVKEDGWQYFAVFDKKGNKYASVKVNLDTADAVETILATGYTNEYNLLA